MQSYSTPLKLNEIDFDNIVYKDIKSNSKKTVVFLKYRKKNSLKNFVLQTPTFLNINDPVKNKTHWDLEIPIFGKKEKKILEFADFFNKLDDKIMYDARIHSSKWFGNFDIEEINYQRTIRESSNKKFKNGTFKIKILNNVDFKTLIQLNNSQKITMEQVPRNSWIKMIFEIQALWINKNGFGIFLKPILISFTPIEIQVYKFLEESEDEIEDIIDSENDIFMKGQNNQVNELESSNLLLQDSLDVNTKLKYSSTSSENKSDTSSEEKKVVSNIV